MTVDYLCISIPIELQEFTKFVDCEPPDEQNSIEQDFGVKLIKDSNDNLVCTAYYSDVGDLLKKIFYKGSAVSSIEHYRNNILYSEEQYDSGKIVKKSMYSRMGTIKCTISYFYNKKDKIIAIRKNSNDMRYAVEYDYDELMRVNSRILRMNNTVINEQKYKYDILDRIVEYYDKNQSIKVNKVNQNNSLIDYVITDKAGNNISIKNKFMCTEYIGTEIEVNGHKTTVKDKCYIDNVMLKKPFTSEDDLDFALSNYVKKPVQEKSNLCTTTRLNKNNITDLIINDSTKPKCQVLPISVRKTMLLAK